METALTRLTGLVDDHLNPLMVKELRQAVRGRFFNGFLLLFLFLQLMVLFLALDAEARHNSLQLGWEVFHGLLQVLLITTMGLMPLIMGYRLYQDFQPGEQDLFMITTLTPRQIIHGKFLGTWMVTGMFYALHLPLATLTVYMRGVDLPTILVILVSGFVYTGFIYLTVIQTVVGPARQHSAAGIIFGGVWFLYILNMFFQGFVQMIYRHGLGSSISALLGMYWRPGLVLVFAAGIMYEWAVAQVTPAPANRSLGVRRFISGFFLGTLPFIVWKALSQGIPEPLQFWMAFLGVIVMFSFPSATTERLEPGRRVLAEISQSRLGRFGAFLLSTGVAGGMAWTAAHTLLLLLVAKGYDLLTASGWPGFTTPLAQAWSIMGVGILYGLNVGLTGFLMRRLTIALGVADEYANHFPVGLFLLTGLAPFFLMAVFMGHVRDLPLYLCISPLLAGERRFQTSIILVQGLWGLVVTLMNLPWLWRKWVAFVPPAKAEAV